MKIDDIKKRVDVLISQGEQVLETQYSKNTLLWVDAEKFQCFRSASLSFIKNVYGPEHPYYKDFNSAVEKNHPSYAGKGIGIIKAIKDEVEGGWLFTVKGIISAEIFSNFLEMAQHLLEAGYKDAAAVMIGSVLEEHLRQLCLKNGIPIESIKDGKPEPKKADLLNSELAKAEVYNKLDQKNVTAWLDLRNKAAHGLYTEYTKEQVVLMLQSVMDFMARNSV